MQADTLLRDLVASGTGHAALRVLAAGVPAGVSRRVGLRRRIGLIEHIVPSRAVGSLRGLQIDHLVERRKRGRDLGEAVAVEVVDIGRATRVAATEVFVAK